MKKGILFDLDGTLWDSSEEVVESWIMALDAYPKMKKYVTKASMQSVMGKTMDEIADILFGVLPIEQRREVLQHCMKVENEYIEEHGGTLLEGLEKTLQELKKDYHLYIVSNCQTGYIEAFLSHHKLGQYFDDFESFGGTGRPKGENIRLVAERNHLEMAVYVGDTQGDYDATMEAQLPFIHARTGYGEINVQVPYVEKLEELIRVVPQVIDRVPYYK